MVKAEAVSETCNHPPFRCVKEGRAGKAVSHEAAQGNQCLAKLKVHRPQRANHAGKPIAAGNWVTQYFMLEKSMVLPLMIIILRNV
jgi:hypothetical protein